MKENKATVELVETVRFELDNGPYGWGYVRPGHRPKRHKNDLWIAKATFGECKGAWWIPIGYKLGDLMQAKDAGVTMPDFIPLYPGQRLADVDLSFVDYSFELGCRVEVRLVLRFPSDEGDITTRDIPTYWYTGRRRKR